MHWHISLGSLDEMFVSRIYDDPRQSIVEFLDVYYGLMPADQGYTRPDRFKELLDLSESMNHHGTGFALGELSGIWYRCNGCRRWSEN